MANKIIRLTESDLTRLVKKVINEQEKAELASQLLNSPRLNKMVDNALGRLNPRELNNVKSSLSSIGVGPNIDVIDAITIADDVLDSVSMESDGEMMEDDGKVSTKGKVKDQVLAGLGAIGIANTLSFALPLEFLIDQLVPQMASGDLSGQVSFVLGLILTLIGGSKIFPNKVNEQREYGLDEPHYKFDKELGLVLLVGASSRQVKKVLKNLPDSLKYLSFKDCDFADFDGIDLCSFPTLRNVNLMGTENNLEEQGYECLDKWDEDGQYSTI
jgi:hypothetical protein